MSEHEADFTAYDRMFGPSAELASMRECHAALLAKQPFPVSGVVFKGIELELVIDYGRDGEPYYWRTAGDEIQFGPEYVDLDEAFALLDK